MRELIQRVENNKISLENAVDCADDKSLFMNLYIKRNPHGIINVPKCLIESLNDDTKTLLYPTNLDIKLDIELYKKLVDYYTNNKSECINYLIEKTLDKEYLFDKLLNHFVDYKNEEVDNYNTGNLIYFLKLYGNMDYVKQLIKPIGIRAKDYNLVFHGNGTSLMEVIIKHLDNEKTEDLEVEEEEAEEFIPYCVMECVRKLNKNIVYEHSKISLDKLTCLINKSTQRMLSAIKNDLIATILAFDEDQIENLETKKVEILKSLIIKHGDVLNEYLDVIFSNKEPAKRKIIILQTFIVSMETLDINLVLRIHDVFCKNAFDKGFTSKDVYFVNMVIELVEIFENQLSFSNMAIKNLQNIKNCIEFDK